MKNNKRFSLLLILTFISFTMMAQTQETWVDTSEYPFKPHYFELEGAKMHYVDEGEGPVLLFVHGTPSWSFDYRHLIKELSQSYRCIAMDHIGFGLSEKPAAYAYSTPGHANNLACFIETLDLNEITLIVHDFGGPIGLSVAEKNPERFKRLIVMNSWLWSSEGEPTYEKMKGILKSPLLPFLYLRMNFSAKYLLPQSFVSTKLSKSIRKQYSAPFPTKESRKGCLAFAHSLLKDQAWFEQVWQNKSAVDTLPTLFIWGMKDRYFPESYLTKFQAGFPNSSVTKINNCGHFPQEEASDEVVKALKSFLLID